MLGPWMVPGQEPGQETGLGPGLVPVQGPVQGPVLELVAVCPIALVSSVRDTSFTCCAPFVGSGMHFRSFNPDPETLLGAWLCGDVLHGCGCL